MIKSLKTLRVNMLRRLGLSEQEGGGGGGVASIKYNSARFSKDLQVQNACTLASFCKIECSFAEILRFCKFLQI